MNHNVAVGLRIKKLRIAKKYTLKQLSEESGLSIGFLSQLERGMSTIAIDSLARVAEILDSDLSSFFENPSRVSDSVIRRHRQPFDQINPRLVQFILSNNIEDYSFLPRLFELLPGSGFDEDEDTATSHDGEEFVYVLEGILNFVVDGIEHTLYPGDSIQIHSNIQHYWSNQTNKTTQFLSINFPNPFLKKAKDEI